MNKSILIIFLLLPFSLPAQQVLSLRMAIDSALKNNFEVRIAKNKAEIRDIYNNYGEAGALPSLNISGSANTESNTTYQKTEAGIESTLNNDESTVLAAGINAGITLFNGFKVYATKEKLELLEDQSRVFLNQQIQNTMAAVMVKYYDIIRQENYLQIVMSSLDIANKELEIVEQRRSVGVANETNVLQARIDLNLIKQNVKNQELAITQTKTELLELLGVKTYFPYVVRDTILIDNSINLDSTLACLQQNPQYVTQEQQVRINEQIVKEIGAQRYPSIQINTSYNAAEVSRPASSITLNRTNGPSAGLSLQIPVFNGLQTRNHRAAAKFEVLNAKLEQERILNSLTADAIKTHQSYTTTLQQLIDQQQNYTLSGRLLSLTLKRFQLNQATILDMKAAQESYEKSGYLLVNLQFAAKVAEIELKLLTYSLGKSGDF
ncbi:MAG: TolC family protein [Bacteroidales bacterium]